MHRRLWICKEHGKVKFLSKDSFKQHIKQLHSVPLTGHQLAILIEMSERQMGNMEIVACPLCQGKLPLIRLQRHLAEHLESISLFVLPAAAEESEDNHSQDAAREEASSRMLEWESPEESLSSPDDEKDINKLDLSFVNQGELGEAETYEPNSVSLHSAALVHHSVRTSGSHLDGNAQDVGTLPLTGAWSQPVLEHRAGLTQNRIYHTMWSADFYSNVEVVLRPLWIWTSRPGAWDCLPVLRQVYGRVRGIRYQITRSHV